MQISRALALATTLCVLAPSLSSAAPSAPTPTTAAPGKAPIGKAGIPDDSIKPVAKTGVPDDSVKPISKAGVPDDSVKPISKSGVADDSVKPMDPKVQRARVLKVLGRTHALLVRAHKAALKGEKGKDDYRKARISYAAALSAFTGSKPALSAKLALDARTHARKVLEANKLPIEPKEATTEPEELAASEGVSAVEFTTASKAAEKAAPSNEELAKSEPAAPPAADPVPSKPAPASSTK